MRDQTLVQIREALKLLLQTLTAVADHLAFHFMPYVDTRHTRDMQPIRLRSALLRALMYMSDCHRYKLSLRESLTVAQLMRVIDPKDAEAHMRVALNTARLVKQGNSLEPFYHYCAFLANRDVWLDHDEASIVKRFVSAQRMTIQNSAAKIKEYPPQVEASALLISSLWTVLNDDIQSATVALESDRMWELLRLVINSPTDASEALQSEDLNYIVGIVMFARQRVNGVNNGTGQTTQQLRQCTALDSMIGKLMVLLCEKTKVDLFEQNKKLRARKRNRVRAAQKKRKPDPNTAQAAVQAEELGLKRFEDQIDNDSFVPALASLSILSHFWSTIRPRECRLNSEDLRSLKGVLDELKAVEKEFDTLAELTSTTKSYAFVASLMLTQSADDGTAPSLEEDILFCSFAPCISRNMFRRVKLHRASFSGLLEGEMHGMTSRALRALGGRSFETLVQPVARNHLESYGQKPIKKTTDCSYVMNKKSVGSLTSLWLRRFRVTRLIHELEKYAGGRIKNLPRQEHEPLQNMRRGDACGEKRTREESGLSIGVSQPPLGQVDSSQENTPPVHGNELITELNKKQRLQGNCTPGPVHICEVDFSLTQMQTQVAHGDKNSVIEQRIQGEASTAERNERPEINMPLSGSLCNTQRFELTQGRCQIDFTQPVAGVEVETPQSTGRVFGNGPVKVSEALRRMLYNSDNNISPPSDQDDWTFWRAKGSQTSLILHNPFAADNANGSQSGGAVPLSA